MKTIKIFQKLSPFLKKKGKGIQADSPYYLTHYRKK